MTVQEAAERLEVTPDLVYRLCRLGRMPHRRIGVKRGVIRISEDDLRAYIAGCSVGPRPGAAPAQAPGRQSPAPKAPRPKLRHF